MTTPIGSTTSTSSTAPAGKSSLDKAMLGKDDFLKLLVTQLQHQDPMNPVEDKEFIGQMAQFSSLEQITNLSKSMEGLSLASQMSQGVGLIGRDVTWADADGVTGSGTASAVTIEDGIVTVTVGEDQVALSQVLEVR